MSGLGTNEFAEFVTQRQLKQVAKERTEPVVWDWLEGGSGDEVTLAENRAAFKDWLIHPGYLSGVTDPDPSTTFLGIPLRIPLMTAPIGCDGAFHPEGHLAIARANEAFGTASFVPESCTHSLEAVAEAAPKAARIFQMNPGGPEKNFKDLGLRAKDAGYSALCVIVDAAIPGWKDHLRETGYAPDISTVSANYLNLENTWDVYGLPVPEGEEPWHWAKMERVMKEIGMPFMLKGIVTSSDAVRAADIGASAIMVSNLGGRSMDGVPATLNQLPEIAEAVGDKLEIALDSGVRRGSDVLKACAMGAKIVSIGRSTVYGLLANGEAGVRNVLELFKDELVANMTLAGVANVNEIGSLTCQRRQASWR